MRPSLAGRLPLCRSSDWTTVKGPSIVRHPSPSLHASARIAGPKAGTITVRDRTKVLYEPKMYKTPWGSMMMPKFVGQHVETVTWDSLPVLDEEVTSKTGCEVISSFNAIGTSGIPPRKLAIPGTLTHP